MTDRLKTSKEIAMEKTSQPVTAVNPSPANQPAGGVSDAGLETFLHLLEPELALPKAAVEPQNIKLRLDKGENRDISLRIGNQGRGYLSGTIEVSENMPGLALSAHRFGLDGKASKTDRETSVSLSINTGDLKANQEYRTSMVINTNGKPDEIVVPLSILVADRKKRSREMTGLVLKYGMLLSLVYWIWILNQVSMMFEFGGILKYFSDNPASVALEVSISLLLLAAICLPPTLLLSGRRLGWLGWLLFMGSLGFVFFGLPEVAWTFVGIIVILAFIPLFISIGCTRLLYYRSPHLSGIFSLAITTAVFALCWSGIHFYDHSFLVIREEVAPFSFLAEDNVEPELILSSQDSRGATYFLVGAEQKEIQITFTNRCWVRISQDGKRITERIYLPGEEIWLGDAAETRIRLGFPKGAVITVNGLIIKDNLSQKADPYNLTIIKQN